MLCKIKILSLPKNTMLYAEKCLLKNRPVGLKTKPETCRKARFIGDYGQYVTDRGGAVPFAKQTTHGGTSLVSLYNADQKAIINAFGAMEKDAFYLFFIDNVKFTY